MTPEQLAVIAASVAIEAGALVRDERPADLGVTTKSSDVDVVTVMDRRSEDLLRARLAAATPQFPVLGEEAGMEDREAELTWVVDPIDGTVNYLYGLPDYCVSVACVTGDPRTPGAWTPVAGAVYQPVSRRLYRACAGGGSVLAEGMGADPASDAPGRPLAVRTAVDLGRTLVATGFAYSAQVRSEQARLLTGLLGRVRDIRRRGSAALDLCAVAEGTVNAYFERTTHVWDVAAGTLMVREAGGAVHGLVDDAPSEGLVLAGSERSLEWLTPLVRP